MRVHLDGTSIHLDGTPVHLDLPGVHLDLVRVHLDLPRVHLGGTPVHRGVPCANGVQAEAWAPFAEGRNTLFQSETLMDIAPQHGRTVGQVVLRWVVQRGIVALATSVRKERMEENLRVFDFAIDEAEMARIAQLDTGQSSFFSHRDPVMVKWISERRLDI